MHPSRLAKLGPAADPSKFSIPAVTQARATAPTLLPGTSPAPKQNVQLTAPRNFDQPPPNAYNQSWSLDRGRGAPPPGRKPTPSRFMGRGGPPSAPFRGSGSFRGPPPSSRGPAPFRGSSSTGARNLPPPTFTPAKSPSGPPPASVVKSAAGIHPDRLKMLGIKAAPAPTPSAQSASSQPAAVRSSAPVAAPSQGQQFSGQYGNKSQPPQQQQQQSSEWRPTQPSSPNFPRPASQPNSNFNATFPPNRTSSGSDQGLNASFNSKELAQTLAQGSQRPSSQTTSSGTPFNHSQPSVQSSGFSSSQIEPVNQAATSYAPSHSQPQKQTEPYQSFGFAPFKLNGQSDNVTVCSYFTRRQNNNTDAGRPVSNPQPVTQPAASLKGVPDNWDSAPPKPAATSGWDSPPPIPSQPAVRSAPPAAQPQSTIKPAQPQATFKPAQPQVTGKPAQPQAAKPTESRSERPSVDTRSSADTASKTASQSNPRPAADRTGPAVDFDAKENAAVPTLTFESSSASVLPAVPKPQPTVSFATSASSCLPKQPPNQQRNVLRITAVFDRSEVVERRVVVEREGPPQPSSLSSLFSVMDKQTEEEAGQEEWTSVTENAFEWDSSNAASSSSKKPVLKTRCSKVIGNDSGWSAPPPPPETAKSAPKPQPAACRPDQWLSGSPPPRTQASPQDDGGWSSSSSSPPPRNAEPLFWSSNASEPARNVLALTRSGPSVASQPSSTSQSAASLQPARPAYSTAPFGSFASSHPSRSAASSTNNCAQSQKAPARARARATPNSAPTNNSWSSLASPNNASKSKFSATSASMMSHNRAAPQRPAFESTTPSYNGGWESDDEDEDPAQIVAHLQTLRKTAFAASSRVK